MQATAFTSSRCSRPARKLAVACSADKGAAAAAATAAAAASRRDLVVGVVLSSLALAAPSRASSKQDDVGIDLAKRGSVKASKARKDALKEKYANIKGSSASQ